MKHAIIGFTSAIILVAFILLMYNVYNNNIRQGETDSTMNNSIEKSVNAILEDSTYKAENEKEFVAECVQTIVSGITSDADVTVNVLDVNYEKQVIAVEIIEKYINERGQISTKESQQIMMFDEDNIISLNDTVEYKFYLSDEDQANNKVYMSQMADTEMGDDGSIKKITIPELPDYIVPTGKTFKGWKKVTGTEEHYTAETKIEVLPEMVDGNKVTEISLVAEYE